ECERKTCEPERKAGGECHRARRHKRKHGEHISETEHDRRPSAEAVNPPIELVDPFAKRQQRPSDRADQGKDNSQKDDEGASTIHRPLRSSLSSGRPGSSSSGM